MEKMGYEPDRDLDNPSSSIFCSHGAGVLVNWDQVPEYAHLENGWHPEVKSTGNLAEEAVSSQNMSRAHKGTKRTDHISLEEIDEIFKRTYKKSLEDYAPCRYSAQNARGVREDGRSAESGEEKRFVARGQDKREEYLLVDGYNIILPGKICAVLQKSV